MDDLAERLTEFSRSGTPRGPDSIWRAAHRQLRRRRLARTAALAATALILVTVIGAVVATVTAHDKRPPEQTPPTTSKQTPANPQKQAAIALGRRMLDEVVLPVGSRPYTGPTPAGFGAPLIFPPLELPWTRSNLVFAHRLWTVNETPYYMWHFVQAHVPFHGYVGQGSITHGTVRTWTFEDDLSTMPQNISKGSLQLAITGDASGPAVIRADSVVGWTKPRPADEFVPATDRTVTVSVVHISPANPSTGPIGKHVTTSDQKLVQPLITTFNHLHVPAPSGPLPGGPPGCGTVVYRVAFSSSPTATPDIVATVAGCGAVNVTVNGRRDTQLDGLPQPAFATNAAHVLGLTDPHFG
jgi:hypothetical protein